MTFAEVLLVVALVHGFVLGTWWSRNRAGGIAHMRAQRDRAINDARQVRRQLAALSETVALATMTGLPAHRAAGRERPLHLVRTEQA